MPFTVTDTKTNSATTVRVPPNAFECLGIAPDGQTLIVRGEQWGPLRKARAYFEYIYRGGDDPAPVPGALCLDVATGQEADFVPGTGSFFLTPDGRAFVAVETDPKDGSRSTVRIYDWPLPRPWRQVLLGAAIVFIAIVLLSKAWRWYRGAPRVDEPETPPSRPPWETQPA